MIPYQCDICKDRFMWSYATLISYDKSFTFQAQEKRHTEDRLPLKTGLYGVMFPDFLNKPCHEKTCLRRLRPGYSQTGIAI